MIDSTRIPYFPANLEDYAPWVAKHGLLHPYGECQCGCAQKTSVAGQSSSQFGLLKDHPKRFIRGHWGHLRTKPTLSEMLWPRVIKTTGTQCWLWQGAVGGNGYGVFMWKRRWYLSHRVAYELTFGGIPAGKFVCHHCDIRLCCNPNHLFLGTLQDNTADMVAKKRHVFGERNYHAKLAEVDVREIRDLAERGYLLKDIALVYGVAPSTVAEAVRRETWRHI